MRKREVFVRRARAREPRVGKTTDGHEHEEWRAKKKPKKHVKNTKTTMNEQVRRYLTYLW